MSDSIPHDYLFKELLSAFTSDFLELFFPKLAAQIEPGSLRPINTELYPGWQRQRGRRADLVFEAKVRGRNAFFVIHVEHEARVSRRFPRRMFFYFARLLEKGKRVYPIVIYSYARPRKPGRFRYRLRVLGQKVLQFRFQVVQLNQLRWQDYLEGENPIVSALMARMQVEPADRPRVKAQCLRLLTHCHGRLEPGERETVSKFIDAYLRLDAAETCEFERYVEEFQGEERQLMREYVTTWRQEGREEGREEGRAEGLLQSLGDLVLHRFGMAGQEFLAQMRGETRCERLEGLFKAALTAPDLQTLQGIANRAR